MFANFILSTGRCGTQWLAKHLDATFGDRLTVVHEPLYIRYLPRQLLHVRDPAKSDNAQLILGHVEKIEQQLTTRPYIECGWECYSALAYFADRFDGRIRIVHLTRHPVPTACSMVSHRYYCLPPRPDQLTEKALLTPFDVGIRFVEYRSQWEKLEPFEKCLFFWTEINSLGLRLERTLDVQWLRLRSEELFHGDGLGRLLDFLELPHRDEIYEARGRRQDAYSFKTELNLNVAAISQHPRVMAIAEALGYDPLQVNEEEIRGRYSV
ncbi:hypothetical protein [Rhodospirillaceae bacterium SYSU D60014]|uniref:hypothetical protein n=1 Tax=Virgifigura deserti TaxID=2268457 RepID=UPI000E6689A8